MAIIQRKGHDFLTTFIRWSYQNGNVRNMLPYFLYRPDDLDIDSNQWAPYNYGSLLSISSITRGGGDPLGSSDSVANFGSSSYAQGVTTADNNITTEDLIFIVVINVSSSATSRAIMSKATDATHGWILELNSSNQLVVYLYTTLGIGVTVTSNVISPGWHMIHVFSDRRESSIYGTQIYVDGVPSGVGVDASSAFNLDNPLVRFIIGRENNGYSNPFDSGIAFVGCWAVNGFFPGGSNNPILWNQISYMHYLQWETGQNPSVLVTNGQGAEGDLDGYYPNPTVVKIEGYAISPTQPIDGYVLMWNNSNNRWEPSFISATPVGPASGDLSGSYPNPIVSKIQGRTVSSAVPADGYIYVWDNSASKWSPQIQDAYRIQNRKVSSSAPLSNQVLKWNSSLSQWEPGVGVSDVVKLPEQGSDPSFFANDGYLYSKDIDGYTELYYMNDRGHIAQMTYDGYLGDVMREDEIADSVGTETSISLTKIPLYAIRRRSTRNLDVYRNGILMRYTSSLSGAGINVWTYSATLNQVQFNASSSAHDWYMAIYRARR